tara:strand:+ start:35 stop:370 length:336 start_codon:yes stop_codon:yes gene_type:complete
MSQPNQAHIDEYNNQQSQTTETKVKPTIITINKPVRLYGDAGVMLGYDNKFQYYKNNELQHKNALAYEYLSVKQNIRTGTIRLSGSILQLPEEYSEIVCLPQSPYQNGGQS